MENISSAPSVSVCIPAYNEETTLEPVVRQIEAVLGTLPSDYEIIICDDASQDQTGAILKRLAAQNPHLRPIFHHKNQGIRATYEELYKAATKETIFLFPADLEWPAACLATVSSAFNEADIIIASRINKNYGVFRSVVSYIFNLVPLALFGIRTDDAGAVKLVRTEIVHKIPIISHSPFSEAERIIRAVRAGYRVKSIPTVTRRREEGVSHGVRFKVLAAAVTDVVRVWWDIRILGH